MITIREIADNNTSISSTRWAFATIIRFDIIIITIAVLAFIVGHFIKMPFDVALFSGIATVLGVLTAVIGIVKGLQGFEPKTDKKVEEK